MLRVLITNEKGEVQVDEQVEGYALTTVTKLKEQDDKDRTGYRCMAVVGGEMDIQGYMALDKNATIELPKRTKEALMGIVESSLDGMEPSQLLRMLQDSLGLARKMQESMRNYYKQQENK